MKNKYQSSEAEFWITNITNMNVCLSDLALTIPAHKNLNLLDKKHFKYSLDQLLISSKSGSLFKKRDKIYIINAPPKIVVKPGLYISKEPRYIPLRSSLKIEEKVYDELLPSSNQFSSEEKFADEFSDSPDIFWNPKK